LHQKVLYGQPPKASVKNEYCRATFAISLDRAHIAFVLLQCSTYFFGVWTSGFLW